MTIRFELLATDESAAGCRARAGVLHTRRGPVATPTFMPVATHGAVRTLDLDDVADSGAGIILGNTFHLMLRPGTEVFDRFGGIHRLLRWPGAVLTDSGGFQIFSLESERQVTEEGAAFRSQYDNHKHLLSPERSVSVQRSIGAEIMMALDVCVDSRTDEAGTREAMERTHRWALRSLAEKERAPAGQALFGIVQGGVHEGLRRQSAAFLTAHGFDGFAIGGLAVGESRAERQDMTELVAPLLPPDRPRYLMGVGTPVDLLEAVRRGVDMFDCILPTKMAQQGYAYTFGGLVRLTKQVHRFDDGPIEEGCACPVCRTHARGYVHHLLKARQIQGAKMVAVHNTHHYQALMRRMRAAIVEGRFDPFYRSTLATLSGS